MLWEEHTRDAPTKKKPTHQKSRATRHSSPTRYKVTKLTDHLPGPPSRRTTARRGATAPHDPATRNPSCTGKTARRPRPPHQHLGPPPWPKSHTTSPEGRRPSRQPRRTSDTRLPPNPCKQLLRLMKQLPNMVSEAAASTRKSSTRGRCPDIHRHVDNRRNTPAAESELSKTMPSRRKRHSRRHRPPGTRSLGFLPESHNNRGCRRSSTASVSKMKNDARTPPLPAPTRSVQGFRPEHLHATPRTGRPSQLLSTATKHHCSHLISNTKTSAGPPTLHRGKPPPRPADPSRGRRAPAKPATHGGPPQQPETPTDQRGALDLRPRRDLRAEENLGCQSRHHRVPGAAAPACLRRRAPSAASSSSPAPPP
jgi:hypothetical protein